MSMGSGCKIRQANKSVQNSQASPWRIFTLLYLYVALAISNYQVKVCPKKSNCVWGIREGVQEEVTVELV